MKGILQIIGSNNQESLPAGKMYSHAELTANKLIRVPLPIPP